MQKEEEHMTRLFTYTVIVIGLGATATLGISSSAANPGTTAEARLATDGAFRDGLYLGKLAAEGGQPLRPSVGRWSTDQDRSMFMAGYHRGYNETLSSARAIAEPVQPSE
jgi:hypothetical protein